MIAPSLSFVAGLAVCYLVARMMDERGKGGLFLIAVVLCLLHGEQAVVPSLMVMVVIGSVLAFYEAARGTK